MQDRVLAFIGKFSLGRDCFLYGCCYWFAVILLTRFRDFDGETVLMYNMVENHFAAKIDGVLYDASGAISEKDFFPFSYLKEIDSLLYSRIVKDCVLMMEDPK